MGDLLQRKASISQVTLNKQAGISIKNTPRITARNNFCSRGEIWIEPSHQILLSKDKLWS